jgi:hypothetical protein
MISAAFAATAIPWATIGAVIFAQCQAGSVWALTTIVTGVVAVPVILVALLLAVLVARFRWMSPGTWYAVCAAAGLALTIIAAWQAYSPQPKCSIMY